MELNVKNNRHSYKIQTSMVLEAATVLKPN